MSLLFKGKERKSGRTVLESAAIGDGDLVTVGSNCERQHPSDSSSLSSGRYGRENRLTDDDGTGKSTVLADLHISLRASARSANIVRPKRVQTTLTLTVKWSSSTMLRPPLTRRSKSETFLNWSPASPDRHPRVSGPFLHFQGPSNGSARQVTDRV
jgi:hypothetical protein